MTIDILCRVVDNFGDIGVAYRLAAALSELDAGLRLRLVVDDLAAFRALCPAVALGRNVQNVKGWTVATWEATSGEGTELFRAERPRTVIECFACGRPDWYEAILFDEGDDADRLIIDLEYLTAESWALDFHRLPSRTRSAKVKKAMFMPGFEEGTGGLIINARFRSLRETYLDGARRSARRRALLETIRAAPAFVMPQAPLDDLTDAFWITVFGYERDYSAIVAELAAAKRDRPFLALAAAGRSSAPFLNAWKRGAEPFPVIELPFLSQETWDEVLLASDFSLVRGEDSLSRAALSGRPFLWNAYPTADGNQLAKVRALLELQRPYFDPAAFSLLENLQTGLNERAEIAPKAAGEGLADLLSLCGEGGRLDPSFRSWSESVMKIGNLAESLLTFIHDFG